MVLLVICTLLQSHSLQVLRRGKHVRDHTMCDPIVRLRFIFESCWVPICEGEKLNEKGTGIAMAKEQQTASTEFKGRKRLWLCTVENLDPRSSKGNVLKLKRH